MKLEDLEKQLQEMEKIDPTSLTPEQLQEMIDKLSFITNIGEEMLTNDAQKFEEEEEEDDDDDDINYEDYLLDVNDIDNNKNESYDENNDL